jgi:hypothetical protein
MRADVKNAWLELCAEAAICEDDKRLEELTLRINAILSAEQQRIAAEIRTPTAA